MIGKTFEILKQEIQGYLSRSKDLNLSGGETVHASPVVRADGNMAIPENALGLTLVNIEEERAVKSQTAVIKHPGGTVSHVNPEIKLNLYMLVTANFKDYKTGLAYLSGALRFFQAKCVFTHENTPSLDASIDRLIVELYTLTFEQQNHLWGSIGAKYHPSVLYRIRMLMIQEVELKDMAPPISGIGITERSA